MRASIPLVLASLLGCGAPPAPAPPPSAPQGEDAALWSAVLAAQRHMHTRYAASQSLVDALTRSDMTAIRATASTLRTTSDPEALPRWQPYITAVQDAANQIELTTTLRAAASGTALLATRCATCHVAISARVRFRDDPIPVDHAALAQQMTRHRWAAQQLWQGLIGPSEDRWTAGAEALIAMPFDIVAQAGSNDVDDAMWIRAYGRRALAARSDSARADVFSDLLVTCAHCHATLRDR